MKETSSEKAPCCFHAPNKKSNFLMLCPVYLPLGWDYSRDKAIKKLLSLR